MAKTKIYIETESCKKKLCRECGVTKDIRSFYFLKTRNTYSTKCKSCSIKDSCKNANVRAKRERIYPVIDKKTCSKCLLTLDVELFHTQKINRDGYSGRCKSCQSKYDRERRYRPEIRLKGILRDARRRCESNPLYVIKGIKCDLSEDDMAFLWERDNASNLKKPSLDRIDNNGNYIRENCQFIEMVENAIKDKKKRVIQKKMDGTVIAIHESYKAAGDAIKMSDSGIGMAVNGVIKHFGGFLWEDA